MCNCTIANIALGFDQSPLNKGLWILAQDKLCSQTQGPEQCVKQNVGHFHDSSLRSEPYKFDFFHSVSRYSHTETVNADGGKTEGNFVSTAAT